MVAGFLFDFAHGSGHEGFAWVDFAFGQRPVVVTRAVNTRDLDAVHVLKISSPQHCACGERRLSKLFVRVAGDFLVASRQEHFALNILVMLVQLGVWL